MTRHAFIGISSKMGWLDVTDIKWSDCYCGGKNTLPGQKSDALFNILFAVELF